nr:hypothetical protein Iba_chr11eCG13230 [Ipomoea batatas]
MSWMAFWCNNRSALDHNLNSGVKPQSVNLCAILCLHICWRSARVVERHSRRSREIVCENSAYVIVMSLEESCSRHDKADIVDICNDPGSTRASGARIDTNTNCENQRVINTQRDVCRVQPRVQASKGVCKSTCHWRGVFGYYGVHERRDRYLVFPRLLVCSQDCIRGLAWTDENGVCLEGLNISSINLYYPQSVPRNLEKQFLVQCCINHPQQVGVGPGRPLIVEDEAKVLQMKSIGKFCFTNKPKRYEGELDHTDTLNLSGSSNWLSSLKPGGSIECLLESDNLILGAISHLSPLIKISDHLVEYRLFPVAAIPPGFLNQEPQWSHLKE